MMESNIVMLSIATIALFLEVLVVSVGAAWIVARIRATTESLSLSITHLNDNVTSMREWLGKVDDKTDKTMERLASLEGSIKSLERTVEDE